MVDLVYYVTNFFYIDTPLLNYYINFRSSIFLFLYFGDTYIPLGISLSCSFLTVFELFCFKAFEMFIFSPVILFIASAVFLIALFEVFLNAFVTYFVALSKSF